MESSVKKNINLIFINMDNKLSQSEKIVLANNQVSLMCNHLQNLSNTFRWGKNEEQANEHDEYLAEVSKKTTELMNEVADYLNNIDAVSEIDIRLSKPIFDELNNE